MAIVVLAVGLTVVLGLRRRFAVVNVVGPSMEPTLRHGDRVLVRRTSLRRLRRGDIVVIEDPRASSASGPRSATRRGLLALNTERLADRMWIVKRVAARPGDPVRQNCRKWRVWRSGDPVPANRFVLLGDNADYSVDSRAHGFYPGEHILGVVVRSMGYDGPTIPGLRRPGH